MRKVFFLEFVGPIGCYCLLGCCCLFCFDSLSSAALAIGQNEAQILGLPCAAQIISSSNILQAPQAPQAVVPQAQARPKRWEPSTSVLSTIVEQSEMTDEAALIHIQTQLFIVLGLCQCIAIDQKHYESVVGRALAYEMPTKRIDKKWAVNLFIIEDMCIKMHLLNLDSKKDQNPQAQAELEIFTWKYLGMTVGIVWNIREILGCLLSLYVSEEQKTLAQKRKDLLDTPKINKDTAKELVECNLKILTMLLQLVQVEPVDILIEFVFYTHSRSIFEGSYFNQKVFVEIMRFTFKAFARSRHPYKRIFDFIKHPSRHRLSQESN